jgi:hypothetical protein
MTCEEKALINYARSAYGFLINHDYSHPNSRLAAEIKDYYDLKNSQNKAVYEVLMKYPDLRGLEP